MTQLSEKINRLKLLLWGTLLTTLVLSGGCSKDSNNSSLTGNWVGVSFTTSIPVDENHDGTANTDLTREMDCLSMEAEFTTHGNFSITSTDVSYEVEIVNGEVVLVPTGCGSYTETGGWSLDAASTLLSLEFEVAGNPETTTVDVQIDLSNDKLIMKNLLYSEDSVRITYSVEFNKL